MKISDELRFLARARRLYRKLCAASLHLATPDALCSTTDESMMDTNANNKEGRANVNILPRSVEDWNSLAQLASVVLVAFTFAFGLLALLTGKAINQKQTNRIAQLEDKAATANQRAAEAEKATAELRYKMLVPRHVDFEKIKPIFEAGPKGSAIIKSVPELEARTFAEMLYSVLRGSGWDVMPPTTCAIGFEYINTGTLINVAGEPVDRGNSSPDNVTFLPEPANTLYQALQSSQPSVGRIVPSLTRNTSNMEVPVQIVVGPKF